MVPAWLVKVACSGTAPAGREADCTILTPGDVHQFPGDPLDRDESGRFRKSWSPSMETISGDRRFGGKWRLTA